MKFNYSKMIRIKRLFASVLLILASVVGVKAQPVPPVPESVTFAGQTIRFDRADLRERMDRELVAFTYSHNLSTLMIKREL